MECLARDWEFRTRVWSGESLMASALRNQINFRDGRKSSPLQPCTKALACSHQRTENKMEEVGGLALFSVHLFLLLFGWVFKAVLFGECTFFLVKHNSNFHSVSSQ